MIIATAGVSYLGRKGMPAATSETFDLKNMTDGQLQELLSAVKKAISERVEDRVADLQNLAREAGFDVQLRRSQPAAGQLGAPQPVGTRPSRQSVVAAKYRNPDNPSQTWSGRGVTPKWLTEKMAAGGSREDFLIEKSTGL